MILFPIFLPTPQPPVLPMTEAEAERFVKFQCGVFLAILIFVLLRADYYRWKWPYVPTGKANADGTVTFRCKGPGWLRGTYTLRENENGTWVNPDGTWVSGLKPRHYYKVHNKANEVVRDARLK